ncbi:unknown [Eggerthella sp. CAG:1427]|nr:unknown [Eggerthella sp. CAG:1427]
MLKREKKHLEFFFIYRRFLVSVVLRVRFKDCFYKQSAKLALKSMLSSAVKFVNVLDNNRLILFVSGCFESQYTKIFIFDLFIY